MSIIGYKFQPDGSLTAFDESMSGLVEDLLPATDPAVVSRRKSDAIKRIDAETDAIYSSVIGNRAVEYTEAEAEAKDFAAGGFTGPVPQSVAVFAESVGITGQEAAENILAQAAAWRGAVLNIRAARLNAKASVRAGDIDAAMVAWSTFTTQIRTALGV